MELQRPRNNNYEECKCLNELPIARAYVPFQRDNSTLPMMEGLEAGTIFPELNMPYQKPDKNYSPKRAC